MTEHSKINCGSKPRESYPGPGFPSSATWPSLLKKHYNGLNQTKLNHDSLILREHCIYMYLGLLI